VLLFHNGALETVSLLFTVTPPNHVDGPLFSPPPSRPIQSYIADEIFSMMTFTPGFVPSSSSLLACSFSPLTRHRSRYSDSVEARPAHFQFLQVFALRSERSLCRVPFLTRSRHILLPQTTYTAFFYVYSRFLTLAHESCITCRCPLFSCRQTP